MNTAEYLIKVRQQLNALETALAQGATPESLPLMTKLEFAVLELRKAHQFELAAPLYRAMGE